VWFGVIDMLPFEQATHNLVDRFFQDFMVFTYGNRRMKQS